MKAKLGGVLEEIQRMNVQFGRILYVGRVRIEQLPTVPRLMAQGRSNICWSAALGICRFTSDRCHFGELKDEEVTDDFVAKAASVLVPAMEKVLEDRGRSQDGGSGQQRGRQASEPDP